MLFSFLMETAMPEKNMLMSFLIETAIHDDREARRRLKIFWIQARRRRIFFVIHVLEVMISIKKILSSS